MLCIPQEAEYPILHIHLPTEVCSWHSANIGEPMEAFVNSLEGCGVVHHTNFEWQTCGLHELFHRVGRGKRPRQSHVPVFLCLIVGKEALLKVVEFQARSRKEKPDMQKKTKDAHVLVLPLLLALFLGILATPVFATADFPDGTPPDADERLLLDSGAFSSQSDGTFGPKEAVSRAELCQILTHLMNTEVAASQMESEFPDAAVHPLTGPIAYMASLGVVTGYPDGSFRPDRAVTIGETVTMLMRLSGYHGAFVRECSGFPHETYMDRHDEWPYNYMYFANAHFKIGLAVEYGRDGLVSLPCDRQTLLQLLCCCFLNNPLDILEGAMPRELLGWQAPKPAHSDFVVEDGVLIAYTGPGYTNLQIPDDLGITRIENDFLSPTKHLVYSVAIPEGVTTIGERAFYSQTLLHTVVLPESLQQVEPFAFFGCNQLKNICFARNTVHISANAFTGSVWSHSSQAKDMGLGYHAPWLE